MALNHRRSSPPGNEGRSRRRKSVEEIMSLHSRRHLRPHSPTFSSTTLSNHSAPFPSKRANTSNSSTINTPSGTGSAAAAAASVAAVAAFDTTECNKDNLLRRLEYPAEDAAAAAATANAVVSATTPPRPHRLHSVAASTSRCRTGVVNGERRAPSRTPPDYAAWKSAARFVVAVVVVVAIMPQHGAEANFGNWWYLGLQISNLYEIEAPAAALCQQLKYLNPVQTKLCSSSRNVFLSIGSGARLAIQECQHQFRNRRWNCTTFNHSSVFGRIVALKSRESAYIYAINSAGVMYAVTRSCSAGEIPDCGCDNTIRHTETKGEFEWGGCSDDISYGVRFAQEFVDSKERLTNEIGANSLMNLHNNYAGRAALEGSLKLMCKCHGVSGSCSVKICWRMMAAFGETGQKLKDRYDGATRVKFSQRRRALRPKYKFHKKPTKDDLVYLNKSPSFCEKNHKLGILGTKGRMCSKDPLLQDSCDLLCCGRGYSTLLQQVKEDCECKFIWCCNVECKTCVKTIERRYCN